MCGIECHQLLQPIQRHAPAADRGAGVASLARIDRGSARIGRGVQGDTILKCKTLVVFYEDTAGPGKKAAPAPAPSPGAQPQAQKSGQQIKRAEAKGDVFVIQKDQTASGENGVFDLKSNTVTMTGNVVVTQGLSVMRGEQMVVNLTTGVTTVTSKGRVEFLTNPGASKDAKSSPAPTPAPTPAPPVATKAAPKGPIRIN